MTKKTQSETFASSAGAALLAFHLVLVGGALPGAASTITHHDVAVTLDLEARSLRAIDRFTMSAPAAADTLPAGFFLAESLSVEAVRLGGAVLAIVDPDPEITFDWAGAPVRFIRLELPADVQWPSEIEVAYNGVVHDLPEAPAQAYAQSIDHSSGLIDSAGVFLSGTSAWVPDRFGSLFTFRLEVEHPVGYRTMSQGMLTSVSRASTAVSSVAARLREEQGRAGGEGAGTGRMVEVWTSDDPQEEIYLVAGRYRVTDRDHKGVLIQTFLYDDDPGLAARYLDATSGYLDLYTELVGPYPYAKFALVENFWQTGFGMPSFTLLGDRVIRLPFIIGTSYGHEILHNWFGNSVYVDWEKGNWCEGLTSYLADHLYKEQQGIGAEYRRASLQAYREFVDHGNDFSLVAFRSRNDPATQAVGYGKAMMTFHMLRQMIGDETFKNGVRILAGKNRFRLASWGDVRAAFESASGLDLSNYFAQWVARVGAPNLTLDPPRVTPMPDGFHLEVDIRQTKPPYSLRVPLSISVAGEPTPRIEVVRVDSLLTTHVVELGREPLAVALDPSFDVFRRLDRGELPASLGQAFGAEHTLVVLPSGGDRELRRAYREFAEGFSGATPGTMELVEDGEVTPADLEGRAVWVLGTENRIRPRLESSAARQLGTPHPFADDSLRIEGESFAWVGHTVVLAVPSEVDPEQAWVILSTDSPAALPGLGRKLPHYRKYGYLVFKGEEPTIVKRGEWRVTSSPLVHLLGGARFDPPGEAPDPTAVPPAPPLIEALQTEWINQRGGGGGGGHPHSRR